ncbi:MAG: thioesterase family protein [Actinomycetia bacterium]|nr:thioesterase family protein [Actinomycetes bacterium]MCP4223283.1 thioesterase family protein [Actinomycetes bacterium]MCP5030765.1 thioesterase family protein [Actinomycetes bacterium]
MWALDDPNADQRALFAVERQGPSQARAIPSLYCRGPWDHGLLHGGPVGGLAGWAAEHLVDPDGDQICSRLTVELLSAVPLEPLDITAVVSKPGRRSRVVDVSIGCDGRTVARATSQWVATAAGVEVSNGQPPIRPSWAADPGPSDFEYPRPGFNCDSSELRFAEGSDEESGPGILWVRLTSPLVAGQETTPFCQVATIADLTAAAGWEQSPTGASYINPDLTLQLTRYPTGPWIAIAAHSQRATAGVGYNDAILYDDVGSFGRVLQSLVEIPITQV